MEYYFCLEFLFLFLHHVLMGFTCSKNCSFPYILQKTAWKSIRGEQNNSLPKRCGGQNQKLQKLIFLDVELHWSHRCEKGVKCAVRLDQWGFLQLLILTPPLFNDVYLNIPSVDFKAVDFIIWEVLLAITRWFLTSWARGTCIFIMHTFIHIFYFNHT